MTQRMLVLLTNSASPGGVRKAGWICQNLKAYERCLWRSLLAGVSYDPEFRREIKPRHTNLKFISENTTGLHNIKEWPYIKKKKELRLL